MKAILGVISVGTTLILLCLWLMADHNSLVAIKHSGVELSLVIKKARLWADPTVASGSCVTTGRPSDHPDAKADGTGTYYTLACSVPDNGKLSAIPTSAQYSCTFKGGNGCSHARLEKVVVASDNKSFNWTVLTQNGDYKTEQVSFNYTRPCCYLFCERQSVPAAPTCSESKGILWMLKQEFS
jgi:hypothetical protein